MIEVRVCYLRNTQISFPLTLVHTATLEPAFIFAPAFLQGLIVAAEA